MTSVSSMVYVIDDDASMRAALGDLLESVALNVQVFDSVQTFLDAGHADAPSCLVLDIRMPGISGLEFHRQMADHGLHMPVIFITAHGDIPMSVQAMKAGAIDFLTKPFRDQELIDAIHTALEQDRVQRRELQLQEAMRQRYDTLNQGEKQVLALMTKGMLNKQIAAELNVSEITVKVRRSQIKQKLEARSVAELTRIVYRMGLSSEDSA